MSFDMYYSLELLYDISHKLQFKFDLKNFIKKATLSSLVAKKQRYVESATTKLDFLLYKISRSKPLLRLTNSLMVLNTTILGDKFWFFMFNYLKETGRYTISPISLHKNQANFIFNDYNFLANYLGVKYDFFNWKYSIRVCINFGSLNAMILKMLLLSLITSKIY